MLPHKKEESEKRTTPKQRKSELLQLSPRLFLYHVGCLFPFDDSNGPHPVRTVVSTFLIVALYGCIEVVVLLFTETK